MNPFSAPKFLKLDEKSRHKKCAELLRQIYLLRLEGKEAQELWKTYILWLSWMKLPSTPSLGRKELADRYHFHLSEASLYLKEHNLLPPIRRGDRLEKEAFGSGAIYLDHVRSAYNVGSILRTTEALRIGAVYFSPKTPFLQDQKVRKTSMGASELVPCFQVESIASLPRPLIALETAEEAEPIGSFLFPEIFTLIIGNEEYGISDAILSQADIFVEIPLFGKKNSMNAACAYAIAAQQIRKSREILANKALSPPSSQTI